MNEGECNVDETFGVGGMLVFEEFIKKIKVMI